jgi:hypothetical protein
MRMVEALRLERDSQMTRMRSPSDPSTDDLRTWAFTEGASEPIQDWELLITNLSRAPLFIQFASDPKCPNSLFFLRCLYLLVGDAVRTDGRTSNLQDVLTFVNSNAYNWDPDIQAWVCRSLALLKEPSRFRYDDWRGGRLANNPELAY